VRQEAGHRIGVAGPFS